jgi:hypothetical protein
VCSPPCGITNMLASSKFRSGYIHSRHQERVVYPWYGWSVRKVVSANFKLPWYLLVAYLWSANKHDQYWKLQLVPLWSTNPNPANFTVT